MSAPDVAASALDLEDIQSGVLSPRPTPYAASYLLIRIEDAAAGRELVGRLAPLVSSVASARAAPRDVGVSVAITHAGLQALGVPASSLAGFSWEFKFTNSVADLYRAATNLSLGVLQRGAFQIGPAGNL